MVMVIYCSFTDKIRIYYNFSCSYVSLFFLNA